jgi:hypothetical protein
MYTCRAYNLGLLYNYSQLINKINLNKFEFIIIVQI